MKKKIYSFQFFLFIFNFSSAQTVFWTENFNNGCTSLCIASSYTGPNGTWTITNNGPSTVCGGATTPNQWYISCAENGNAVGVGGSNCASIPPLGCGTPSAVNATLHVGNIPSSPSASIFCPIGDCGAAYDAGGYCVLLSTPPSTETDKRAESPAINCTGKSSITISFKYLENGDSGDYCALWYFDGSSWNQLSAPPPTILCGAQGVWTTYSFPLPASANNNSNVKIGFRWVNDDDGNGTDPSFAVDDVQLSVVTGAQPVANFSVMNTICAGQCITFTDGSTGTPTSWNWNFPGGNPNNSTQQNPSNICYNIAGTYIATLIASNANGSATAAQIITVNSLPAANAGPDVTICPGGNVALTATGGGNYLWNTGQTTPSINVSPTTTTTYSVTVSNSCGSSDTSVNVIVTNNIIASISGNTIICSGQNTILTASGGSNYSWSNGTSTAAMAVAPTTTTTYSVFVSSGSCADTTSINIIVNPKPTANAGNSVTISQSASTTLSASGGGTYLWSTGESNSAISVFPTTTTDYCVTVTDANGCSDSSCVTVFVLQEDCSKAGELYLPNAFSPNGDGENDELQVYYGNLLCIKTLSIAVYNRWGEKVFESTDPIFKWDGTFKNKKSDSSTYTYYLKATLNNGKEVIRKGNVSLMR